MCYITLLSLISKVSLPTLALNCRQASRCCLPLYSMPA